MKIFLSGDWHLDLHGRGVDRFGDLEAQVERVKHKVAEHEPDLFVHLGDVTDPDSGARTIRALALMRAFCDWVPCEKRILAGNHDVIDDASYLQYRSAVSPLRGEHVHVHEVPAIEFVRGKDGHRVGLLYVPYVSGAHAPAREDGQRRSAKEFIDHACAEALLWAQIEKVASVYAFVHLDVDGALVGSEERMLRGGRLTLPEVLETDPRVKLIVGGHIHKPQRVREKILLAGSFERLDFSDRDDEKGLVVLEV